MRIRLLDDGRIEICIYGDDSQQVGRIESVLDRLGALEFRILANAHDHADLISLAKGQPKSKEIKTPGGTLLAHWVVVRPQEVEALKKDPEIATREATGGGLEVLVVNDRLNVTGAYLKDVRAGYSPDGCAEVEFAFNSKGGLLFGDLTGDNVSDEQVHRQLGIILDDCLYTAPVLRP